MGRESDLYGTTEKQETLLPMLEMLDQFCSEHDIKYGLDWGTLLGAVRHNGFIPWDDDADIMVDRENYRKLLAAWKDTDKYVLRRYLWTKRIMPRSKDELGPAVDVFVMDACLDNEFLQGLKLTLARLMQGMMHERLELNGKSLPTKLMLTLSYGIGKLFTEEFKYKMLDSISQIGNGRKTKYVSEYNGAYRSAGVRFDRDVTENYEMHSFESLQLPITSKWDMALTRCYGDYMTPPPEDKRKPKHS